MVHNRPRLHPQRLTRINYRAYLYTRSLQTNYYRRITSLKARFMGVNPIRSIPKPLHERHPRMAVDLVDFFGICVGDLVQVRWGADRHKRGVVLAVKPRTNQVIVEGCALVRHGWPLLRKKHVETTPHAECKTHPHTLMMNVFILSAWCR